ncbi:DHA2 family efflux MFS transporter permease subunit [Kitasatospora sp. NPDC101176]|uniref:DHA2 family efflux MFS transporter permease subunit n=1 Tax=Kitasatospora sp. NPDC101176 TaxID=3364099 RepID=UPI003806B8DD
MQQHLRSNPRSNPRTGDGTRAALYALCVGFFMIGLDATVVNVAIPAVRTSLHAGLDAMVWVNSAYALCYAVPLLLTGRLGDRFGPKRVFLAGLAGFTAASLACALAPTAGVLIAARAVQGLAAALIAPQAMAVIVHMFPAERRGRPLGVWSAVGALSMAAGPLVGGLAVATLGWRGIFLVNLPIGAAGWVAARRLVPDHRPAVRHRFDPLGIALSATGLFALVFAVQSGAHYDWGQVAGPVSITRLLVLAVVCLAAFVLWQHRNPREPLLPLRLFRDRDFTAASTAGAAMGCAMGGLFLPLMVYFQDTLGCTALQAGAATVPMFALSSLCARWAGRRADTVSPRLLAAAGFATTAAGLAALLLLLHPGVSLWTLLPPLLVCGIGIGGISAPLAGIATRSLRPGLTGAASGVFTTTRQLGGALGSAATGLILQSHPGGTTTTATQAALVFPVAALLAGLACCAAVRARPVAARA